MVPTKQSFLFEDIYGSIVAHLQTQARGMLDFVKEDQLAHYKPFLYPCKLSVSKHDNYIKYIWIVKTEQKVHAGILHFYCSCTGRTSIKETRCTVLNYYQLAF